MNMMIVNISLNLNVCTMFLNICGEFGIFFRNHMHVLYNDDTATYIYIHLWYLVVVFHDNISYGFASF